MMMIVVWVLRMSGGHHDRTLEDASIISYSGNKLIREPEIETTYPDDQLTYAWYIYKEDQDKAIPDE